MRFARRDACRHRHALVNHPHIAEAPRALIEATGAALVKMPRNGVNTSCCGAGGAARDRG